MLTKWVTKVTLLISIFISGTHSHVLRSSEINGQRKLFGGYRITPKQCKATRTLPMSDPRSEGPTICMFNHECAQRNGVVVGACMDGFLFGACCQIPITGDIESTLIKDAQNSYFQHHAQLNLKLKDKVSNPSTVNYDLYVQPNINKVYQQLEESNSNNNNNNNNNKYESLSLSNENTNYINIPQQTGTKYQTTIANEGLHNEQHKTDFEAVPVNGYGISTSNYEPTTSQTPQQSYNTKTTQQIDLTTNEQNTAGFQVNMNSVNVSSHSAPSQTDDILLQALQTYSPQANDRTTFSTEVPMKISSAIAQQTSSESVSFEEEYQVSQVAVKLVEKPQKDTQHSTSQSSTNLEDFAQNAPQQNLLLPDSSEFTHSDITHPGAESELLDTSPASSTDFEESSAYFPIQFSQKPNATAISPDEKYVLVQTISNEQSNKKHADSITTSSPITTNVDSIESILSQLNNQGPNMDNTQINMHNNIQYAEFSTSRPTPQPTSKISESQSSTTVQMKKPVTVSIPRPEGPSYAHSDQQAAPSDSYMDIGGTQHDTSEFNKMPAFGVAYPVDMTIFDEEDTTIKQNFGPSKRPQLPYSSLITAQNYHTQRPSYNQLPEEITISSHATKVQENYHHSSPSTVLKQSSTNSPQYDETTLLISSSSMRPKPKPKPTAKRPTKRPSTKPPNTQTLEETTPVPQLNIQQDQIKVESPVKNISSPYGENFIDNAQNIFSSTYPPIAHDESNMELIGSYGTIANVDAQSHPTKSSVKPNDKIISHKPISTSYVTGPSSPRPPTTFVYHDQKVPPLLLADDKLDSFVHSTAETFSSANASPLIPITPTYQTPIYVGSATPIYIQRPQALYNNLKPPGFVKIQATVKPPVPTVLITPKPTVLTSSTQKLSGQHFYDDVTAASQSFQTSTLSTLSSISQIYNQLLPGQPELNQNSPEYSSPSSSLLIKNEFSDSSGQSEENTVHPAFAQSTTESIFSVPSDDKPAFPGYYGPTPTYPAFAIPDDKGEAIIEETYTSPNDYVNFPPVRNPNLNMSAQSSAVTTDLELSTPTFVEDTILKNKMNTLVHKIVESLQGNFDALSEMIDNNNDSIQTYQAVGSSNELATRSTTIKPNITKSKTTKRPSTQGTKAPNRRTTLPTRQTPTKKTTIATKKPPTRKSTRRPTKTTTTVSTVDEIVDQEDEEDVNPIANEVSQDETLSGGADGSSRKIQCGMRPLLKSGRIVGGKGAAFGAFPWQVLVRESTWLGLFTKNKCGGVLISNRYVITAAHCQPGFLASLVAVMGEFDISGDLESKRAVTKNVKRVIVHRQYDAATFENDLALLELDSPVQFDIHIVPICMPQDRADFTGRMATVTGWGRLKYGGGVPSVLQEVQVPIIENSVCQEMFNTAGHNKKILNSFLCAGYANGQKDSCEGDSGGPLVLQRPDGRYELAGTVSHGIKCAAPYLPGVYMRTTFYKPWLRSITGVK